MKKGFTLLELLVVILIIGIITSIAMPKYLLSIERSRATSAIITLSSIRNALNVYVVSKGYPSANTTTPAIWDGLDFASQLPYSSADGYMRCDNNFRYSISYRAGEGTFYIEAQRLLGKSLTCAGYPTYGIYSMVSKTTTGKNYRSCSPYTYGNEITQSIAKAICNNLFEEGVVNYKE